METHNFYNSDTSTLLPTSLAVELGEEHSSVILKEIRKKTGQYFTPLPIASLMASFSEFNEEEVKILDPGCGTFILSCSLIESIVKNNPKLKSIKLVGYEIDKELIGKANLVLHCLKDWLNTINVSFEYQLFNEDFVVENAGRLNDNNMFFKHGEFFDIIISNPPFFKLPSTDEKVLLTKKIVSGQFNIYGIFMALSMRMLKENGELIFITPRSFTSGNYFKLFREFFFKEFQLERIHLFDSRKETFKDDNVLQETIIIKGRRTPLTNPENNVIISSSHGTKDLENLTKKTLSQNDLINLNSNGKILHLPTNDLEESIVKIFKKWEGSLNKYNIQISTGPVVSFRSKKYIKENFENGSVLLAPLYWLHNVRPMEIDFSIDKPGKGQYLVVCNESKSILIPNKNYVFLRRFSSKDDKKRLIAAPYFCNSIKPEYIGVENKVNYIYRPKGNLERSEVLGLCALLNSELFDMYFRIFNGNVNVSATELREMTLPPHDDIKKIGNEVILSNDFSVKNANNIVNEILEFNILNHA